MGFIYMGSPYTGTPEQQQERYEKARWATAQLLIAGTVVYSPIVHCHDLALCHALPGDIDFWHWYDRAMIEAAHTLMVLTLPGWEKSKGLRWEIDLALELGKTMRRADIEGGRVVVSAANFT